MMKKQYTPLLAMVLFLLAHSVYAQSWSYTTQFPGTDAAGRNTYPSGSPQLSENAHGKPVPTNDFWSDLIKSDLGGKVFNYPLSYRTEMDGLVINYTVPQAGPSEYRQPMSDVDAIKVGVQNLSASKSTVSDYSDWTVTADWQDGTHHFNSIIGQGMPFTYFTKANNDVARVTISYNIPGTSISGNKLIISNNLNNSNYIVFAPTGSTWIQSGGEFTSTLNGKNYWSIALLPPGVDVNGAITTLEPYAYVFPANTQVSWSYNESTSEVRTTFTATPDVKEGPHDKVLLGLLPHQWDNLAPSSPQPNSYVYHSVRGKLKVLGENSFVVQHTFSGILTLLPDLGKYSTSFDPIALKTKIDAVKGEQLAAWTDSYNEGQVMNKLIQAARIADQTGYTEAREQILNTVQERLEDWFVAESGEVAFLFYYNQTWSTLLGYPAGHRQDENLNDHHFHWGYFIHAAAALEQFRPGWAEQWGEMVNLLIRDAANPSRTDPMFPFLRNFSPYAGHAWANGFATEPFGNDQESTSESMQFNSSLVHWGQLTGDTEIRDLGIYLYTTELSAIEKYWFNKDGNQSEDLKTIQPEYQHEMIARIWGAGYDNGTWWTGDIAASYGIQLYPVHGGALYMGYDTDYVKKVWDGMTSKTDVLDHVANPNLWYDTYWSFLAFLDADQALSLYNNYPDRAIKFGTSDAQTYHWLHTMAVMGQVADEITADYPIAAVFNKNGDKTYVAHNYGSTARTVTFSDGYQLTVPAGKTTTSRDISAMISLSMPGVIAEPCDHSDNRNFTLTGQIAGGNVDRVEFYENGQLIFTDYATPYELSFTNKTEGIYKYYAKAWSGNSYNLSDIRQVIAGLGGQAPFTTSTIPGTIEGGHYDLGGNGIAYYDVDPNNPETPARPDDEVDAAYSGAEGLTVGYTATGEWLEYTFTATSGLYQIDLRTASNFADIGNQAGEFSLELDCQSISNSLQVTNTGDWDTYTPITAATDTPIAVGEHTLRIHVEKGGFNIGKIIFTRTGDLNEDTQAPTSPTGLQTTTITQSSIGISWNSSSDNVGVSGYNIYLNNSLNQSVTSTSATITSLQPNTTYTIGVLAKDAAENESNQTSISATTLSQQEPDTEAPSVPVNLTNISTTTRSISFSWTASIDNVAVTGYDLYLDNSFLTTTTTTGFTVTGLNAGTTYTFGVSAKDGAGNTSPLASASATTSANPSEECTGESGNGDYTYSVSGAAQNPTITFVPARTGVGSNMVILYYGTSPTGNYPGYIVTPNTSFQIVAGEGQEIHFYFTYSVPEGGEQNTMNNRHQVIVGSCGSSPQDTEAPSQPGSITITSATPTSLAFSWGASTDNTAVTGYEVLVDNNVRMTVTSTSAVVSGLNPNTTYTLGIKALDAAGNVSGVQSATAATPTAISTCTGESGNGDYTYEISNDASNPTITFQAARSGVGQNIVVLYYGNSAGGTYPGYIVNAGQPYQITATTGQAIYFYYTYSVPEGGEQNTMNNRHRFEVGNCSSGARNMSASGPQSSLERPELALFPNPVDQLTYIHGISDEIKEIIVYNLAGNEEFLVNADDVQNGKLRLDTKSLSPGIYFVRFYAENQTQTLRFIRK